MRRWSSNIVLMVVSTLIGVVFFEVGLRATGVSYPILSRIDNQVGASLRPGAEGMYTTEGQAYVRINSAGLRDREHLTVKPPHTVRIAVLGDSYAEAQQVPLEETFWSVLERELKGCSALAGREPEVINFGVSGYGTAQELMTLRHRVWLYDPDIVLLAFLTGNDIRNNSRFLEQDDKRPYFVFQDDHLVPDFRFRDSLAFRLRQTDAAQVIYQILNSSRTFQMVTEAKRTLKARSAHLYKYIGFGTKSAAADESVPEVIATPWEGHGEAGLDAMVYVTPQDQVWKEAWQVTESLVVLMRDETQKKGADFFVVTLSNGPQVHPDPVVRRAFAKRLGVPHLFYPDFRIRDLGHREGFSVLNLAPLFQTYAEEHQIFLHGFKNTVLGLGHWNNDGHHLAGGLIAKKLCSDLPNHFRPASPQR